MEFLIQRYKELLKSVVPVSSDALLILLGLSIYLVTCLVFRLPLSSPFALLPSFLAAVLLEGWEIVDYYGFDGLAATSTNQLASILLRHSRDVVVFNIAPVLVYLATHWMGKA